MNAKSVTNSYINKSDFKDDDFIFDNNEDEFTVTNQTKYNEDPFMSLKKNYVRKAKKGSSGFIKIFTLVFILMLAGWFSFMIYTSYNPEIIQGNDAMIKYELFPDKVKAKTNKP